MIFPNEIKTFKALENRPGKDLRQLPMFFRCDPDYVYRLGGSLYREILDKAPLTGKGKHISIDSRVHMLFPGFWPGIPGWHCDDFFREGQPNQPNLALMMTMPEVQSTHLSMCLGDTAPTEFAGEPFLLSEKALKDELVYRACDHEIQKGRSFTILAGTSNYCEEYLPYRTKTPDFGDFVRFDCFTWHRAVKATAAGWRLFIRITESDHWKPLNELRTQVNCYIDDPSMGW